MTNAIRALPPELIGQIAAGEVVERPAAAIKELCENALDAGASTVLIEINGGGVEYMRVADNGCGIPAGELRMAFERHATSKIRKADELSAIRTLGFRGEALHSIAAVARVTLTSRTRDADCGAAITVEGGVIKDIRDAACPVGTSVVVRDLFYNTPVRRKFLKSPMKESATVTELGARLILSSPGVSFRVTQDGKTVYHSAGDGRLDSALCAVFGVQDFKAMRRVEGHGQGLDITGYVGVGDLARGNRSQQYFFINGRAMRSALLSSALEEGCRQRVTIGRFPVCAVHIAMPYQAVDVNVHPNKWEVRFQDERAVHEQTLLSIRDALSADTPLERIPTFDETPEPHAPAARVQVSERVAPPPLSASAGTVMRSSVVPVAAREGFVPLPSLDASKKESLTVSAEIVPPPTVSTDKKDPLPALEQKAFETVPEPQPLVPAPDDEPRVIGVVFDTYILAEYRDQLLLIDQHAAHERLLYERLRRELDVSVLSQQLLVPEIVPLSAREYARLCENLDALRSAGFDVEPYGDDSVMLRALPMVLGAPAPAALIRDVLEGMGDWKQTPEIPTRTHAIIQMACKHAVKGGERLPEEAVKRLVRDMAASGVTPTCPHGRPLVVALTRTDLEKRFRRIQNG